MADAQRILIIDDDPEIVRLIVAEVTRAGFEADWQQQGRAGLAKALTGRYDVITLDRMMPDIDGLQLLTTLRSTGVQTPVLVLSALGDVDERIRGLRAGGDDYLRKPFNRGELVVRLEVLARRRTAEASSLARATNLQIGDLTIDLIARSVARDSIAIPLLPTEYQILEFMARNAGRLITRTMLFEAVWGYRFDPGTNVIDVHLGRLRRKIERPDAPQILRTVRGQGYLFG